MPYKEKEIEKMFYTIGEVARMFDVNTSHIRFWSKEFDVIKPATNKKGNRLFTKADVENIRHIYHLVKEKGFTLKGAKVEMQNMKKKMKLESKPEILKQEPEFIFPENQVTEQRAAGTPDHDSLKNSLLKIRSSLVQLKQDVEKLETEL